MNNCFPFGIIIVLMMLSVWNRMNCIAAGMISTSVGAVGGALWLALWARWGVPLMPLFLSSTILGILFASTVAYTPLGKFCIFQYLKVSNAQM